MITVSHSRAVRGIRLVQGTTCRKLCWVTVTTVVHRGHVKSQTDIAANKAFLDGMHTTSFRNAARLRSRLRQSARNDRTRIDVG